MHRVRSRYFRPRNGTMPTRSSEELDALADALDLRKLTADQFVRLLDTIHMLGESGAGVDLRTMSTDALVNLIAKASKDQIKALATHETLRPFLLDLIFSRMSDHLIEHRVRDLCVVIAWRFTKESPEDGYDRYQTVIEDGICASAQELDRTPDTTITVSFPDFLKMTTGGNAVAASMFVSGKVRVKGDYAVAARFISYFDIPKSG